MNLLLVPLLFMSALFAYAYWRLAESTARSRKINAALREEWQAERSLLLQQLGDLHEVLNKSVGGLSYRVKESVQIAQALQSKAPHVFKECWGLAHWLHASDQFFHALADAAGTSLNEDQLRRLENHRQPGDGDIFQDIYASAGLAYVGAPGPGDRMKLLVPTAEGSQA